MSVVGFTPRLDIKNNADSGATLEIKRGSNSLLKLLTDSKMDLRPKSNDSSERRKSLQPHGSAAFSLKQIQLAQNDNLSKMDLRKRHLQLRPLHVTRKNTAAFLELPSMTP